jgi:hypothetical protein
LNSGGINGEVPNGLQDAGREVAQQPSPLRQHPVNSWSSARFRWLPLTAILEAWQFPLLDPMISPTYQYALTLNPPRCRPGSAV